MRKNIALDWPHLTSARSGHRKTLLWEAAPKLSWQLNRSCQFPYGFWVLFLSSKVTYCLKEDLAKFWMQIQAFLRSLDPCYTGTLNFLIAGVVSSLQIKNLPLWKAVVSSLPHPIMKAALKSQGNLWQAEDHLLYELSGSRDLSCLKTVFNLPPHRAKGCFETILLLCDYCWVFSLAYRETGDRFLVLILITSVWKRFLLTAVYFWIWKKKIYFCPIQMVSSCYPFSPWSLPSSTQIRIFLAHFSYWS